MSTSTLQSIRNIGDVAVPAGCEFQGQEDGDRVVRGSGQNVTMSAADQSSPESHRVQNSGNKAMGVSAASLTSLAESLRTVSAFTDGAAGGSAALSGVVESLKATSAFGDVQVSAGMGSVSRMLEGLNTATSLKDVYSAAGLGSIPTIIADLDQSRFDDMVRSLRNAPTDSTLLVVNRLFTQIKGTDTDILEVSQALDLTVPFGHDSAVRAACQIVMVALVAAALFGVSMLTHPVFVLAAAALTATGTPKPKEVWKATGKAYDSIYGDRNYHPERAIDKDGHRPKSRW
jgi:hypothetical protein